MTPAEQPQEVVAVGDLPCTLGSLSVEVIGSGWRLVHEVNPCPIDEPEDVYLIVLPSGAEVRIIKVTYEKLTGWRKL